MTLDFNVLFSVPKPVIGMIHLAGSNQQDKVKRALSELALYQGEGVDGAIIENYHGSQNDVYETLRQSSRENLTLVRGVNLLGAPCVAFRYANAFGARFVQFDSVQTRDLNLGLYEQVRKEHPLIAVLGGVQFKYTPETGNPLEQDLTEARSRCEAIVTTGSRTGVETPLDKLKLFRRHLGNFPLVVGAGVTAENAYVQLQITDAAIIGSYFKQAGNTELAVDRKRVREIMDVVRYLRRADVENR